MTTKRKPKQRPGPTTSPTREFTKLVEGCIEQYGTAAAVAEALGITGAAWSRAINRIGSLSVESCLRLAELSGRPPLDVLRMAHKAELATLLENLFTEGGRDAGLNSDERALVEIWRIIENGSSKQSFRILLCEIAGREWPSPTSLSLSSSGLTPSVSASRTPKTISGSPNGSAKR